MHSCLVKANSIKSTRFLSLNAIKNNTERDCLLSADSSEAPSTAVVLKDSNGKDSGAFDLLGFLETKEQTAEHPEVCFATTSLLGRLISVIFGKAYCHHAIQEKMKSSFYTLLKCVWSNQVAAEKKRAAAKRGQEATQTSDAKYDAQFAFGHGLAGEANKVGNCNVQRIAFALIIALRFKRLTASSQHMPKLLELHAF